MCYDEFSKKKLYYIVIENSHNKIPVKVKESISKPINIQRNMEKNVFSFCKSRNYY